jgi:hypothetical protein
MLDHSNDGNLVPPTQYGIRPPDRKNIDSKRYLPGFPCCCLPSSGGCILCETGTCIDANIYAYRRDGCDCYACESINGTYRLAHIYTDSAGYSDMIPIGWNPDDRCCALWDVHFSGADDYPDDPICCVWSDCIDNWTCVTYGGNSSQPLLLMLQVIAETTPGGTFITGTHVFMWLAKTWPFDDGTPGDVPNYIPKDMAGNDYWYGFYDQSTQPYEKCIRIPDSLAWFTVDSDYVSDTGDCNNLYETGIWDYSRVWDDYLNCGYNSISLEVNGPDCTGYYVDPDYTSCPTVEFPDCQCGICAGFDEIDYYVAEISGLFSTSGCWYYWPGPFPGAGTWCSGHLGEYPGEEEDICYCQDCGWDGTYILDACNWVPALLSATAYGKDPLNFVDLLDCPGQYVDFGYSARGDIWIQFGWSGTTPWLYAQFEGCNYYWKGETLDPCVFDNDVGRWEMGSWVVSNEWLNCGDDVCDTPLTLNYYWGPAEQFGSQFWPCNECVTQSLDVWPWCYIHTAGCSWEHPDTITVTANCPAPPITR